jgi:hypothetical protein
MYRTWRLPGPAGIRKVHLSSTAICLDKFICPRDPSEDLKFKFVPFIRLYRGLLAIGPPPSGGSLKLRPAVTTTLISAPNKGAATGHRLMRLLFDALSTTQAFWIPVRCKMFVRRD